MSILWISACFVTAAAIAAFLAVAVAAGSGPQKAPSSRCSHANPTVAAGGLGVIVAVAAVVLLCALWRPQTIVALVDADGLHRAGFVLGFCALVAAVGLVDDLIDLGASVKVVLLGLASLGIAAAAGPVMTFPLWGEIGLTLPIGIALLGSTAWVFLVVNAVNFMDGADGLVGGSMAIAGAGLCLCAAAAGAGEPLMLGAALAGGFVGFLPWNAPKARVFMGDVGALFAGALFAGASLMLAVKAPSTVYVVPLLILPLLVDVLLTLAWRAQRGRPLLTAHRDHAYQARLRSGASHFAASREVWAHAASATFCASAVATAVVTGALPGVIAVYVTLAMIGVQCWAWVRVKRRIDGPVFARVSLPPAE